MNDQPEPRSSNGDRVANQLVPAAASFLNRVLDLGEDPAVLMEDLSTIKRDANAAIYSIQLDSSVGPAAFLIYAYILDETGGDGQTGRDLFDAGLTTLQQAAERSAPGPRAVAHAETDVYGFILATTPGTYRALLGEPEPASMEASPRDLPPTAEINRIRSDAAEGLLLLLRDANEQASTWLSAIQSAGRRNIPEDLDADDQIEFNEAETELALFLLDEESIGALLRALNLLVSTAQQQASGSFADDAPANDDD